MDATRKRNNPAGLNVQHTLVHTSKYVTRVVRTLVHQTNMVSTPTLDQIQ
jgi:hypothetical protein